MEKIDLLSQLIKENRHRKLYRFYEKGLISLMIHKGSEPAIVWEAPTLSKVQRHILTKEASKFITEARRLLGLSN